MELLGLNESIKRLEKAEEGERLKIVQELDNHLSVLVDVQKIDENRRVSAPPLNFSAIREPENEDELRDIIKSAYNDGNTIVRVVGSGHSVKTSIFDEDEIPRGKTLIRLSLKKLRGIISLNRENKTVRVRAGTHIGLDPKQPDLQKKDCLVYNLEGYALPELGGIIHQTVGGFLSTGSSGGSTKSSLNDSLLALRIIDGQGNPHEFSRNDEDNSNFLAAAVSMGLLGVITEVTFQLVDEFFVSGDQVTAPMNTTSLDYNFGSPVDIFGDGNPQIQVPSLQEWFKNGDKYNAEYARIILWPQKDVERAALWRGKRIPVYDIHGNEQKTDPYWEFPGIFGSEIPAQLAAGVVLKALNLFNSNNPIYTAIASKLLKLFVPLSQKPFQEIWLDGLCMDNKVSDYIIPVSFTELWFPLDDAKDVMNAILAVYQKNGAKATGTFCTEIYAAKKNDFFLSPSSGYDVLRYDWFWDGKNLRGSPEEYYQQFWDAMKLKFKFRCHWGKYLPADYGTYVRSLYPKYDQWMAIREEMDPKQVFVTPYWRKHLNIET